MTYNEVCIKVGALSDREVGNRDGSEARGRGSGQQGDHGSPR